MPSSVSEGSRPREVLIFSYSSGVIPCSLMTSGVIAGGLACVVGIGGCPYFRTRSVETRHCRVSKTKAQNSNASGIRFCKQEAVRRGGATSLVKIPLSRPSIRLVADEIHHHRHRRSHRSRKNFVGEGSHRHRCRSAGGGKAARDHH